MNRPAAKSSVYLDPNGADQLPGNIRFGTSTWTYPGWKNLVYKRAYRSDKEFRLKALTEYSACPWFRTVGIDSTFYAPPKVKTLELYASQVPPDFRWVSKVWEQLTIPAYPQHRRYGSQAGKSNPHFLDHSLFLSKVLPPYREAAVTSYTGPFVFQFPTIAGEILEHDLFLEKLGIFLKNLPDEFRYAVEIRNPEFLTADYFKVLNDANCTHCFNHWNIMPRLRKQMEQAAAAGGLTADFFLARILTPLGTNYSQAVKRFAPYDSIKEENPEMRADVVALARRAIKKRVSAFIIVNNRCEGNSPLTIQGIGRKLLSEQSREAA